ncbi:MAG: sensor histidine kinase [Candidatus Melainabacteria bacterium]|nr:MAG: sensor histidine kinase [Candidatus Melainabacteria bacterium]
MKMSIRSSLLTTLIIAMSVLYLVRLAAGYIQTVQLTDEVYDEMLLNSVDSLAGWLDASAKGFDIKISSASSAILTHNNIDKYFYEVFDAEGKRLTGNTNLIDNETALRSLVKSGPKTTRVENSDVRIMAADVPLTRDQLKSVTIVLAETLNARKRFFEKTFVAIAITQFLAMSLSIACVYLFVSKAFLPFKKLKQNITERDTSRFAQLPEAGAPAEMAPFLAEFNKMCAAIEQDVRSRERFISNAAHQLRTPLAGLRNYASFGLELDSKEELKDVVLRIDKGLSGLTRLVNQLLALARAEREYFMQEHFERVELNNIVSRTISLLEPEAVNKGIELSCELTTDSTWLYGHPLGLEQLVANLIENAIAYSPNGGEVIIRTGGGPQIVFIVEDGGPGIPAEERERIFERFYRIRGSAGSGSGLGLSIVKEVATCHQAEVTIEDGNNNKGTRFTVKFHEKTASSQL